MKTFYNNKNQCMNTFKNLIVFLFAGIVITGCDKVSHRKTAGGMPYQLYKGKGTQKIYPGNILKLEFTQKINDSVYFSSVGKPPVYIPVKESQPYDISEIWTKLKVGDSVVATQMMDTFIKRSPMGFPPQFKKGMRILSYVKVLGVFTSDTAASADEEKGKKEFLKGEIAFLGKYLSDKNISVQKTTSGAYVQIINPGTGDQIDSGKSVTVNYTGTSFSGKRFDSNTDTSFQHAQPYTYTTGSGMIKGFDEAVQLMKKGATAKVYIPSLLAYGPSPTSPLIKPYEHLIFDLAIVDVKDPAPAKPQTQPQSGKVELPQQ
jgi:FKBP-type peptidyl-prolyl cis-trans isomerase FkpA